MINTYVSFMKLSKAIFKVSRSVKEPKGNVHLRIVSNTRPMSMIVCSRILTTAKAWIVNGSCRKNDGHKLTKGWAICEMSVIMDNIYVNDKSIGRD